MLHRGQQGVPLKGPFLALFSQGILTKVSENAPFRVFLHLLVFCIFCFFWNVFRLAIGAPFRLAISDLFCVMVSIPLHQMFPH